MPVIALATILLALAAGPSAAQSDQPERAWCVANVTRLSNTPEGQMKATYGNTACVLNPGPAARAFLDLNYGGLGKRCRCM